MRKSIRAYRENSILYLLNEMANAADFHSEKQKQRISHKDESHKEFFVDFIRDGRGLYFEFNGFGDLMGYYVKAISTRYQLAENRIGINNEVALYLSNPQEKTISILIEPCSMPR